MVDQKQGATSKDEKVGKPVASDSKTGAGASAANVTGNDTAAKAAQATPAAPTKGTGDGNLQADADRQGRDAERHHREVHRRGEADEGRREHVLPDDQGQARADGQKVIRWMTKRCDERHIHSAFPFFESHVSLWSGRLPSLIAWWKQ